MGRNLLNETLKTLVVLKIHSILTAELIVVNLIVRSVIIGMCEQICVLSFLHVHISACLSEREVINKYYLL